MCCSRVCLAISRVGLAGCIGVVALVSIVLVAFAPGYAAIVNLLLVPLLIALPLALSTPTGRTLELIGAWFAVLIAVVGGVLLGGYLVALP